MTTDPITIAREVLETAHEDETVTVCTIPDNKAAALARTVLAIAELTDGCIERYDRHPDIEGDYPQGVVVTANLIRARLNGETHA